MIKQTGTAAGGNIAISLYNVSTDQIGAPRIITRQSDEAVVWRWDTAEAFGATAPDQNPGGLGVFGFNQRFPGQVADMESGLFQNWHREYCSRCGRYMQSDPIGLAGGINTFASVGGDPLSKVDPNGLDWQDSIRNWWSASLAGFQSQSATEFGMKMLQGLPQEAALLGAIGTIKKIGSAEQCVAKGVATIETGAVRFSQDSVKGAFRNGTTLNEAVDALRVGGAEVAGKFPPIRLVPYEGVMFTLDNRRLLVFSQAGQRVPFRMATEVEIAREFTSKFSTTAAQGWGQFITVRP